MRQVGGSLGIAIMGAIVADGISSARASGDSQPAAFVHGFHHELDTAAVIAIAGAIIALTTLHHARHRPEPQAASEFVEAA
jgi:sugar/nucleoside kinase (ribokinase family)